MSLIILHGAQKPASGSSLLNNLVAYWKLDEASGSAADEIGSNDLTATGSPVSTTGKVGSARNLTAASSQYLKTSPSGLAPGTSDWTLSVWLKPATDTGLQTILNYGAQNAAQPYIWIHMFNDNLWVQFIDGSSGFATKVTGVALGMGTFHHLVLVFDRSGNLTVYKNNVLSATHDITANAGDVSPSGNLYLGAYQDVSDYFDGAIDEVKIWHRALTVDEIDLDYNNGIAGNPLS